MVLQERDACARLAEDHKCSYDCYTEDLDGNTSHSGYCKYDIASDIRGRT